VKRAENPIENARKRSPFKRLPHALWSERKPNAFRSLGGLKYSFLRFIATFQMAALLAGYRSFECRINSENRTNLFPTRFSLLWSNPQERWSGSG
jgi:hypothetical protein